MKHTDCECKKCVMAREHEMLMEHTDSLQDAIYQGKWSEALAVSYWMNAQLRKKARINKRMKNSHLKLVKA